MIHFTGDINLSDWLFNVGFGIGTRISHGLDPLKFRERNTDDLWIGNFEGVTSSVSSNKGIYAQAFRIEPEHLRGLHHMDFYSVANNHTMEHGSEAFCQTVKAIESFGSKPFGMADRKSVVFEYNGRQCSITGACFRVEESEYHPLYWHCPEYSDIKKEVDSLPKDAFKIFHVHWGNEYINRPSATQKRFAHWLIDIGFDLIIGMHPHVLQGYEDYRGKRIYYSLGNCVFDMPSEQCKIGALVTLDFNDCGVSYKEEYIRIDHDCCPHIVSENEIPKQWQFAYLNKRLLIADNSEAYHREALAGYKVYRNANRSAIIRSAFSHPVTFILLVADFIKRRIM